MSLVVLGLNHRTAPIEVRERIVFDAERLPRALASLRALPGVQEALIVSTCNRTELYCVGGDGPDPLAGMADRANRAATARSPTASTASKDPTRCGMSSRSPRGSIR